MHHLLHGSSMPESTHAQNLGCPLCATCKPSICQSSLCTTPNIATEGCLDSPRGVFGHARTGKLPSPTSLGRTSSPKGTGCLSLSSLCFSSTCLPCLAFFWQVAFCWQVLLVQSWPSSMAPEVLVHLEASLFPTTRKYTPGFHFHWQKARGPQVH